MRTLRLTIAYEGTAYVGWQRQPNGISIQQLIEEAFAPFTPGLPPPVVNGASRTDAGVHAHGQVASVRVPFDHPAPAVQRALNIRLPTDVRIMAVDEAHDRFHARIDARGKVYQYRLARAAVVHPMHRAFVWHVPAACDLEAMREAAHALVGTHDFAAFQASGSSVVDTRRTIRRIDVRAGHDEVRIEVEGDGFLRHMVRIIVGSLVDVGVGTYRPAWLADVLAGGDRRAAGRTAPASGLVLDRVFYGTEPPGPPAGQ